MSHYPAKSSSEDQVSAVHSREVFERRSSAVPSVAEGKQAGCKVWILNAKATIPANRSPREVFERRSSAVPSVAEGKQAGEKAWKLNCKRAISFFKQRSLNKRPLFLLTPVLYLLLSIKRIGY